MSDMKTARRPGTRAIQVGAALIAAAVLLSVLPGRLFDAAGPAAVFLLGFPGAVVLIVGLIVRAVKRPAAF